MTINPGSGEAPAGTAGQAQENMVAFVAEVVDCGGSPDGSPVRLPDDDTLGRFGFGIPAQGGGLVRVLMPGTAIATIRDDPSAAAPCLFVDGQPWWWRDAAGQTVHALRAAFTADRASSAADAGLIEDTSAADVAAAG